ncbi:MAG: HAD-IC family P-type ATPase, partial [Paramuribaculum sp.]|nr:HAD-IC family P-type ATPase [Paramuribaculum sp.]
MSENTPVKGLTDEQVSKNRHRYGSNLITPPPGTPLWKKFLQKFSDPLIIILLVAGAVSIGISCYEYYCLNEGKEVFFEPVGIFMAIILATGLSFWFEYRADCEFSLLQKVDDEDAVTVLRAAGVTEVPKRDVVHSDIVILSAGNEVPADGELIEAVSMSVDESTLTGEPMCNKTTDTEQFDSEATFPSNHVMRGSKIMEGHGKMRVFAVGDNTEHGHVFHAAQIDNSVTTPLQEQLNRLGGLISKLSYVVAGLVLVAYGVMFFMSHSWVPMEFFAHMLKGVMIAVTLVVVAVPEGLPMAVTLSLAYSMRRMLQTQNLVRKLHACETMGATTVICTDKTGTLTQNRMQVAHADFFGSESPHIFTGMALNSTAQLDFSGSEPKALGNPTEGALLLWMLSVGVDYRKLREECHVKEELPFSTERKFMATVARTPQGKTILYVKGAPEIVMNLCTTM